MEPDLQNNTNILSKGTNSCTWTLSSIITLISQVIQPGHWKCWVHQQPCRCRQPRWPLGGKWHTDSQLLMAIENKVIPAFFVTNLYSQSSKSWETFFLTLNKSGKMFNKCIENAVLWVPDPACFLLEILVNSHCNKILPLPSDVLASLP